MKRVYYAWEERRESFRSEKKKNWWRIFSLTENIGRAEASIRIRGKKEQRRSTKNQCTQSSVTLILFYLKKAFIGKE